MQLPRVARGLAALIAALWAMPTPAGSLAQLNARGDGAAHKLESERPNAFEANSRLRLLTWSANEGPRLHSIADAAAFTLTRLHGKDAASRSPASERFVLSSQRALRRGGRVIRLQPVRDGREIFGEGVSLLLDFQSRPRALTSNYGGLGQASTSHWTLQASAAAGQVLGDYGFDRASMRDAWTEVPDPGSKRRPYQSLALPALLTRSAGQAQLQSPVRAKPVWFRLRGRLRPAWYLETIVVPSPGDGASEHLAHVVAADSGEALLRFDLQSHAAFTYQAYADADVLQLPQPGPQGRLDYPHPSASPDGFVPITTPPGAVRLAFAPLAGLWPSSAPSDAWLGPRDGSSRSNNVDAYADLQPPDGFSPGDLRAHLTGIDEFLPGYSLQIAPDKNTAQIESGVINAFYLTNYLHDWFYAAGFDEAAGNAQDSNFARGGVEGDRMLVETLDHSGTDNANMATPADGGSPRLQLMPFKGPWQAAVEASAPPVQLPVQVATFGPPEFDINASLAAGRDASGASRDGCEPLLDDHSGQIVLLDTGICGFTQQAQSAQNAGARAVLIASTQAEGFAGMQGAAAGISIPALGLSQAGGNLLRQRLLSGPLALRMHARRLPRRDSAMDSAIVAHEWGHYISNRLIGDSAGLSNHQGRAMGEGWADFHALLLLVREQDTQTAQGADYAGSYGVMNFVSAGGFPSFSPNASYFGIRRFPYSTRRSINPLTFSMIASDAEIPATAPRTPATVANDNASVHNAGELWASALWDCYAGLLRESLAPAPRLSFDEARRRMSEYLVTAYQLTPHAPTYTEARDALLAAMLVSDLDDLGVCGAAFAGRGMGLRAQSASRLSLSLRGIQQSFVDGGDLRVDSIELAEVESCDSDGVLDGGESGLLRVSVRNSGTRSLTAGSLEVAASSARLAFPAGASAAVPATAPQQRQVLEFPVVLSEAGGRQAIEFEARPDHPDLGFESGEGLTQAYAVDYDTRLQASREDNFAAAELVWQALLDEGPDPELALWRRKPLDALRAVAHGPDFGVEGSSWLLSPELDARDDADLIVEFDARHSFEASVATAYDGGVIEFSVDGGASWRDASELGVMQPEYNGTLSDCCDNPLGGRAAFVRNSAGWPSAFTAHRIDFGRRLAGERVQLRFGVATDAAVGAPGWEIDRVRVSGISNTPFPQVVADARTCNLTHLFYDGFEAH